MNRARRPADFVAVALLALVAACGPMITPEPTTTGSSQASSAPVGAAAVAGPFRLTIVLPKATWRADEPITGVAILSVTGLQTAELGGSGGGLIGFDYREVGGRRHVEPASTADCTMRSIGPADPISEPLGKSGGFDDTDPNADFYRTFLQGPDVRLPPGEWQITAVATFIDGEGCDGQSYTIGTPVTITVVP